MQLLHTVASGTYGMQQHVVDIVCLQFTERVAVNLQGTLTAPGGWIEVAQFGGDEHLLARIAFEGDARGTLGEASAIGG